ncbi:MAG: alpha/beta hydrolase [Candidatus Omnitrophica bacterium]|nr:alpha/beta hydrolase [Candidatus Omnitrophota bacterium]
MLKTIFYFIFVVIFFLIMMRYKEKQSIYFPEKEIAATPSYRGLPFEDVYFETTDGVELNGWFIPAKQASITLLFAHGNAGNISHRLEKIALFNKLRLNVFIFDYRGYGKSKGKPDEKGLYLDGKAAYDYLVLEKKIPPDEIVLYGESIGGAVVIDLATKANIKALITEGTFTCARDIIKVIYPFVPPAVFASRFDSIGKIKNISASKLIIHSVDDEMIPFSLAEKLFKGAPPPKQLLKIKGSHNSAFLDSEGVFLSGIREFLKSADTGVQ